MSASKKKYHNIRQTIHHCELILSYWCRLLNIDITISTINSTICKTIISYRGPGDIIAFSSNGTLSTIEIYNCILSDQVSFTEPPKSHIRNGNESHDKHTQEQENTETDISNELCIKPVHTNMHFKSSNLNSNSKSHTWHPTLCCTLDYHYIYQIGGCDPLKGLFGESTNRVNIFNIHNMTQISLPSMQLKRAKCSATILPPNIPYHDYKDKDIDTSNNILIPNIMDLFKNLKSPKIPPPPMPPMLKIKTIKTPNEKRKKFIPKTPPPNYPIPPLPSPLNIAPLPTAVINNNNNNNNNNKNNNLKSPMSTSPPPISIKPSISSPTTTPPPGSPKENVQNTRYRDRKNNNNNNRLPDYCIFVSGGINGSKLHKKCEIFYPYESEIGKWNGIMSMKQGRCGHISVYMGSTQWKHILLSNGNTVDMKFSDWKDISDLTTKIFVCGGKREHGNGITSCESFNFEINKWIMCQRAPFTNHGYQSGCWLTNKQSIAMISHPMDGNKVAIYKPEINKWNIIGDIIGNNTQKQTNSLKPNNINNHVPRNQYNLIHFYPLIGTLWLFNQEYLYIMGDDYKCKSLEIYDERINKWIAIGIKYTVNQTHSSMHQKYDQLLELTNYKQFDAFHSVS